MSETDQPRRFGDVWNEYVDELFPEAKAQSSAPLTNPGDEWMNAEFWEETVDRTLFQNLEKSDPILVEIGPGAGKQARMVLAHYANPRVYAFDLSTSFQRVFKEAFPDQLDKSLFPVLLNEDYTQMLKVLQGAGVAGQVDAFYSYDAMVHVDLQSLVTYFITAMLTLADDGLIVMDVANIDSEPGFQKLLRDVKYYYGSHGAPCPKFMYLSPPIIDRVLGRLGFTVEFLDDARGHCMFVARLTDRARGLKSLEPVAEDWGLTPDETP